MCRGYYIFETIGKDGVEMIRSTEIIDATENWERNIRQRVHGKTAESFFGNNMTPEESIMLILGNSGRWNMEVITGNLIGMLESCMVYRSSHITLEERDDVDEVLAMNEDDLVAARDKVLEALGMRCETFAERHRYNG